MKMICILILIFLGSCSSKQYPQAKEFYVQENSIIQGTTWYASYKGYLYKVSARHVMEGAGVIRRISTEDLVVRKVDHYVEGVKILELHPNIESWELGGKHVYFLSDEGDMFKLIVPTLHGVVKFHKRSLVFGVLPKSVEMDRLIATLPGSSGAPIFYEEKVVGILVGYMDVVEANCYLIVGVPVEIVREHFDFNF